MTATQASQTVNEKTGWLAPLPAWAYGLAGLIPFVATAVAAWMVQPQWLDLTVMVQVTYAAVILSFLGAVHWGTAMTGRGARGDPRAASTWKRLGLGVLPALVGWGAVLVLLKTSFPSVALGILIVGFAGAWLGDRAAVRTGHVPFWYLVLRGVLTLVAIVAMAAVVAKVVDL